MHRMSSKIECETAARSLSLRDTTAFALKEGRTGPYDRPNGCIYNANTHWLAWYDITNTTCGSQDDKTGFDENYNCLCKHGKIKNIIARKAVRPLILGGPG